MGILTPSIRRSTSVAPKESGGQAVNMKIGEVRVAEDSDFALLKVLLSRGDGWVEEYQQGSTRVWTRPADNSHFRMIRLKTVFSDVKAEILYDVLHDPDYRKTWDKHMLESKELGMLNPNNDLSYYAIHCPAPVKNRDFVLQRSWLQTGSESYIINHSVHHRSAPPKKGFIRGISYLTGLLVTPVAGGGCELGYVAHSDPKGQLPIWVTNKLSTILAPKMVKRLHKACLNYPKWKNLHQPHQKPWLYPEQISGTRIMLTDCEDSEESGETTPTEEESLDENQLALSLDCE